MKITFAFNNTNWKTEAEKIKNICDFFSPIEKIVPTVLHTSFKNIPYQTVGTIGGIENTPGTTLTPMADWYSQNITKLSPDSDIILLYINYDDCPHPKTSVGIMQGQFNGVVQTCIFGIAEADHAYQYDKTSGLDVDQGNCFEVFSEHEISHALYFLYKQAPDNTHAFFYSGQPTKVLPDLTYKAKIWDKLSAAISSLKILIADLTKIIMSIPTQSTPSPTMHPPKFPPMIIKWMNAITTNEGADSALNNPGNLKVSTLTKTWGAKPGRLASDGGWLAKFDTLQAGKDALCNFLVMACDNQLISYHQARNIQAFTVIYAGNPPQGYINSIMQELGVTPDTQISTFLL